VTDLDPNLAAHTAGSRVAEAGIADVGEVQSLRRDVWRRFRRNRLAVVGLTFVLVLALMAIFAPLVTSYTYTETSGVYRGSPSGDHWFGTDTIGRDVFTRVVYGARISLRIGVLTTLLSLTIGVLLGSVAGFFGGIIDTLLMRVTDVFLAIPYIILAIAIATVFGRTENSLILVLGLTQWMPISRIVRSSYLGLKRMEYVEAAQALGFSRKRIMFGHILPNAMQPIIVYGTVAIGGVILAEAALSFVGVGPQPPTPSWGLMVREAGGGALSNGLHMLLFPGLAIFATVLAFVFIGDGLRDALDPKLKS
jgi:ABC-type dipeptide/oligopeptide/nickel transport system permease subunit